MHTKSLVTSAVIAIAYANGQDAIDDQDGNDSLIDMPPLPDHGAVCQASPGMFGQWADRDDCTCNDKSLELTHHGCCMRQTENIFKAGVTYWDNPEAFWTVTMYNMKRGKNAWERNMKHSMMHKMKDWMKQYKKMKYGPKPFEIMKSVLVDIGKNGHEDMLFSLGIDSSMEFIWAEDEEADRIDALMGKAKPEAEMWRSLMRTIIQTAILQAEDKEQAMFDIFNLIHDIQSYKHRTGGKFDFDTLVMQMYDVKEYEKALRPIDVVRCVISMLMTHKEMSKKEEAAAIDKEAEDVPDESADIGDGSEDDSQDTTADVEDEPEDNDDSDDTVFGGVVAGRRRRRDNQEVDTQDSESNEENEVTEDTEDAEDTNGETDVEKLYGLLDIIEMAYQCPTSAKFWFNVKVIKWMHADADSLGCADDDDDCMAKHSNRMEAAKNLQWMSTVDFAKDVLKWNKCFGYAEVYGFDVILKMVEMKMAGTYDKDTFIPLVDNFASGAGRLPTSEEMYALMTLEPENISPEKRKMMDLMWKMLTGGVMMSGVDTNLPLCDVPKKKDMGMGYMGMMSKKMGMFGDKMDSSMDGGAVEMANMSPNNDLTEIKLMLTAMSDRMDKEPEPRGPPKYELFSQHWADAAAATLEMNYGGVALCPHTAATVYRPYRYSGVVMGDCDAKALGYIFYADMIMIPNFKHLERSKCLTLKQLPCTGAGCDLDGWKIINERCDMDKEGTDEKTLQKFKYCSSTGQLWIVGLEDQCLSMCTERNELVVSPCKGGVSRAYAFGRRIEDGDEL